MRSELAAIDSQRHVLSPSSRKRHETSHPLPARHADHRPRPGCGRHEGRQGYPLFGSRRQPDPTRRVRPRRGQGPSRRDLGPRRSLAGRGQVPGAGEAQGVQRAGLRPGQRQLPVPPGRHLQGAGRGHLPGDPLGPRPRQGARGRSGAGVPHGAQRRGAPRRPGRHGRAVSGESRAEAHRPVGRTFCWTGRATTSPGRSARRCSPG